MSTDEIIIFAALVTFSVLCVLGFLTWTISLVCICTQKNVNLPRVADKDQRKVGILSENAIIMEDDENGFEERPSLFTPTTNYEGYLSIHTAWAQGRSSINNN